MVLPRSRSLILALGLAGAGCASAPPGDETSEPTPAVVEESALEPERPAGIARYEDVTPSDGRDSPYHRCVRRVLLESMGHGAATMVCRPSFRPEYAVTLFLPKLVEIAPDPWSRAAGPWTLVLASATVWSWPPPDYDALDAYDFQVRRSSIPIDAEIASEIADACRMVVRRARHPRPVYLGEGEGRVEVSPPLTLDGEAYEFDADGYHGTSHSPDQGPARDLIALLDQVAALVDISSETERALVLRDCADRARALRERAEQLPW